jgi:hypothetical protein
MSADRKDQTKEPRKREDADTASASAAGGQPSGKGPRKPTPIERRDWRGEGVVGDRHTD